MGFRVMSVDRNVEALHALAGARCSVRELDLESGAPKNVLGELGGGYDGIVVTNYLHRPLLPMLVQTLAPGGVVIYETFAAGNERFGRPTNPDFLLRPGELLDLARAHRLRVVADEDLVVDEPRRAAIQRIVARRTRA